MNRARLRALLPIAVGVVAVGAAIYAVARNWHSLRQAIGDMGVPAMVLAVVFGAIGVYAPARAWRALLAGLGANPPARTSDRVFFVSQLGKYLPGSVWPVLAQMEFGKRTGIGRRTMLAANLTTMAVTIAVGLGVAGICLPISSTAALHRFWWTFLLIPVLLMLLHPRAIPALMDWALQRVGRPSIGERISLQGLVRAAAWAFVGWIGLGLHLFVLTRGLGAHGASGVLAAIGGEALAICAGILFVPAPAGAGVRDAVLVATLSPSLGTTHALAASLVSRGLLIVVDLALAVVFGIVGRNMRLPDAARPARHEVQAGPSAGPS